MIKQLNVLTLIIFPFSFFASEPTLSLVKFAEKIEESTNPREYISQIEEKIRKYLKNLYNNTVPREVFFRTVARQAKQLIDKYEKKNKEYEEIKKEYNEGLENIKTKNEEELKKIHEEFKQSREKNTATLLKDQTTLINKLTKEKNDLLQKLQKANEHNKTLGQQPSKKYEKNTFNVGIGIGTSITAMTAALMKYFSSRYKK